MQWTILAVVTLSLVGSPLANAAPAPVPVKKALDPKIRALLLERVKALVEQLDGQFERVKIGKDPFITFSELVWELGEAELELADDRAAELAVLERRVQRSREAEKEMDQLQKAGLQTKQGVAQAKAARLKAEIQLEKKKTAR